MQNDAFFKFYFYSISNLTGDQDDLKKIKKSFLENMTCTICTTDIYIDAVSINCGHTFCKCCIMKWQRTSPKTPIEPNAKCPLCNMVITTLTPNISVKNHINELCEVFLDETGKKEREKSIEEHSEILSKIIDIIMNAEDIEQADREISEYLDRTIGHVPTNDDITDDNMPEGTICVGCTQETHCTMDLCINCSRLAFNLLTEYGSTYIVAEEYRPYFEHYGLTAPADMDQIDASVGSTEPDSTTSNAPDPAATSAPADMEQPGTGVGAILGEEPNITVDQVINENTRPEQDQFTMNWPGPSAFTVTRIINGRAATSAPADVGQSGAGVGAILGEEPDVIADQVINENTRPEQEQKENRGYQSDLTCPQFNMNWPGPSVMVGRDDSTREMLPPLDEPVFYGYGNILNRNVPTGERPPPQNETNFRIAHILSDLPRPEFTMTWPDPSVMVGRAPTEERPLPRDELAFTVPHIINGPASTRNFPRPSPYTLDDRPRKSSNRRALGR